MLARAFSLIAIVMSGGCLLELDATIACGDGYIDESEECDPEVRRSPCDNSESCHPTECYCEAKCGNGVVDPGEECDYAASEDNAEVSCASLGEGFVGGIAVQCTTTCSWDRGPCNRCGDGIKQDDEVCDGFDVDEQAKYCRNECYRDLEQPPPEQQSVACTAQCTDECVWGFPGDDTITAPGGADSDALGCCIKNNFPQAGGLSCCDTDAVLDDGVCTELPIKPGGE